MTMNGSSHDPLSKLKIPPDRKSANPRGLFSRIAGPILFFLLLLGIIAYATRDQDAASSPVKKTGNSNAELAGKQSAEEELDARPSGNTNSTVLTASGYIIPKRRIELSPKFPGTVEWIGVDDGDRVEAGEVIVRLEDDEYQARLLEAEGNVALATANLENAEKTYHRQLKLSRDKVNSDQALDDAQQALDAAKAQLAISQGRLALAQTWVNWCTIQSPIAGVVLDRLVDEEEFVSPQSLGGPERPATVMVILADLKDLQIEVDVNEQDTARVFLNQSCRITPEAHPNRHYAGHVAEISPEADRNKGTLEVRVQVIKPDHHLVPELSAKVEFHSYPLAKPKEQESGNLRPSP